MLVVLIDGFVEIRRLACQYRQYVQLLPLFQQSIFYPRNQNGRIAFRSQGKESIQSTTASSCAEMPTVSSGTLFDAKGVIQPVAGEKYFEFAGSAV